MVVLINSSQRTKIKRSSQKDEEASIRKKNNKIRKQDADEFEIH
jgi:hypothetical protein